MAITEPLYHLPLERYANTIKDSSSGRVYCATDAPSPQWRFTRLAIVLSCLVAIIANPCSTRICNYENICLAQLFNCKQAFANMQDYCFVAFNNLQLWECVFFVDSFDSIHSQFLLPPSTFAGQPQLYHSGGLERKAGISHSLHHSGKVRVHDMHCNVFCLCLLQLNVASIV